MSDETAAIESAVVRRCDGCRFWERIKACDVYPDDGFIMFSEEEDNEDNLVLQGYCKRFPPVIVSDVLAKVRELQIYHIFSKGCITPAGMINEASIWPVTFECDSCGEWSNK